MLIKIDYIIFIYIEIKKEIRQFQITINNVKQSECFENSITFIKYQYIRINYPVKCIIIFNWITTKNK